MEDAEPPGSSHADDVALDAWLRNQVLKRCVNVARPPRAYLCLLRVSQLGIRRAAFAKSAHVESKRVDSRRRQLSGQFIPPLTCPVDLVQQQHARAWLGRGKIAGLQDGSIGCLKVNHLRSRRLRRLRYSYGFGAVCASSQRGSRENDNCQQQKESYLFHWTSSPQSRKRTTFRNPGPRHYSWRRATSGSMRNARRAGI